MRENPREVKSQQYRGTRRSDLFRYPRRKTRT
jgi:hypothetical protein